MIDVHNGRQEILKKDKGVKGEWIMLLCNSNTPVCYVFIFADTGVEEDVCLTDKVFPEPV